VSNKRRTRARRTCITLGYERATGTRVRCPRSIISVRCLVCGHRARRSNPDNHESQCNSHRPFYFLKYLPVIKFNVAKRKGITVSFSPTCALSRTHPVSVDSLPFSLDPFLPRCLYILLCNSGTRENNERNPRPPQTRSH